MPALAELEEAWVAARDDPASAPSSTACCATSSGARRRCTSPTRLSEAAGRAIWLKREDLIHTGAHKINNALGQALLARRMGKQRIIAETGAGQHGVATATACALLDLECVVYMGVEDIRRQRPTSSAWSCSAPPCRPVEAGRADAQGGDVARRSATGSTNVGDTHYIIGSAVGPAPYPAIVRDLQRVIGDEARAQLLEREGRLPDRVDRLRRRRLERDRHLRRLRRRRRRRARRRRGRRARALETGRHGAPLTVGGRPGVLHGSLSAVLQDDEGQILEAHSISAGLDYPGVGPRARLAARLGPRALRRRHRRRGARDLPARHAAGGDHPGARDRPRAAPRAASPRDGELDVVCCSGRGDKDLAEVLAQLTTRDRDRRRRADRRGLRRPRQARGADAVPDGRLPRPGDVAARSARPTPTAAPTSSSSASRSPTRSPTAR